jgi:hypothetical protein
VGAKLRGDLLGSQERFAPQVVGSQNPDLSPERSSVWTAYLHSIRQLSATIGQVSIGKQGIGQKPPKFGVRLARS